MEETEQQQQNSGNATTINACIDLNNYGLNTYKNISYRSELLERNSADTGQVFCVHAIKWNKLKEKMYMLNVSLKKVTVRHDWSPARSRNEVWLSRLSNKQQEQLQIYRCNVDPRP